MAISDFFSGGQTPDYLSGLLDDEQLRRLKANAQQNALMQFGLSALAQGGYSQTPVGIGEILGKAGMAGMQGYQQGIQSGIEGIGTRAKLEELKRKREQQAQIDTMIGGITDPAEALAARIAPEQYVTSKFKPKSSFNILTPEQAAAYQLPTDSGQKYQMTDKGVELIGGTQTKDVAPTNLEKLQTYRTSLVNADPNDPRIKQIDAAINKETNFAPAIQVNYGQPVAGVDANGNPVFFQPAKGGGPPSIVPGVTPQPPKPAESVTKQVTGIDNLQSAIENYREKLKTWNPKDALDPNKRSTMTTTYNNMMLQAKEAYGLGVLNGPDYSILTDTIADPTSLKGMIYGATGSLDEQAKTLSNLMTNMKSSIKKSQNIMPKNEKMPQLAPQDQQALDWANKNPNDKRAIAIKKKLGVD